MNAYHASYRDALARATTPDEMVDLFDGYTTAHANTAPAAIKRLTIRGLESRYRSGAEELWQVTLSLSHSGHPTAEEVAAILLAKLYAHHAETTTEELKRLADSTNWEVREWVASALGEVTLYHFNHIHTRLQEWIHDPSENVRRAVVLGTLYASRTEDIGMANSFSAQAGARLAPRAPQILHILSRDTRQVVQKAWKKAFKRIQKEIPGWTGERS